MARITVIGGVGYVGLSYAAAFADLGHDVVGLDVDADKVAALTAGRSPIYEPGLEELLRRGQSSGRLRFTVDYGDAVPDAEFVFICVGTPSDGAERADMRFVASAARLVGQHGSGHTVVVNKSTMPVGSVDLVAQILAEYARDGVSFAVVSNPEFLREGSAIHDIVHPERVVLGASDPVAAELVAELYAPLGARLVITDPRSAEMIKYASNAFLAAKISFINEVATICEALGADVTEVARGVGMDERIGPGFLRAGVGFGGSCFPKDVRALAAMARDAGMDTNLLTAVLNINQAMRSRIVDKLAVHLGRWTDRTIGVLGLAFKPDTDDIREAPALDIVRMLLATGAKVQATDPVAMPRVAAVCPELVLADDAYAVATGADAVLLLTEWDEYLTLDLGHLANAMRGRLLLDGRNALDPAAVVEAGLTYEGVGRSSQAVQSVVAGQQRTPEAIAAD